MITRESNIYSIMKGIAIIAVVMGHCSISCIEGFVNQFHLAVFYFLAGYFFKSDYVNSPWLFIKKRINRLYFPFIQYGTVFLLLHNIFCRLGLYDISSIYSLSDFARKELFMLLRFSSNELFMGAMWFLGSLFFVSVSFLLLCKLSSYFKKGDWVLLVEVIACLLLGRYAISLGLPNPYSIYNTLMIVPIFYLGYVFKRYQIFESYINLQTTFICLGILLILYISGISIRLQPQSLPGNNLLLYLVISIMGVVMVYGISILLQKNKVGKLVALCGDLSFEIMALHFICFKLVTILQILVEGSDWNHLADFPVYSKNLLIWSPLYLLVGVVFPILLTLGYRNIKQSLIKK